jgi:gluconate 2-dehydrogenase alpha chain
MFSIFDDRHINIYMGPNAQKHTIDDFNADNFDHKDLGFIRGAQISAGPPGLEGGPIAAAMTMNPPPGVPRWGAAYRDFLAKYYTAIWQRRRRPRTCLMRIRSSTSILM